MDRQLGGVIYYGLEKDDFRGECATSNNVPYPMLTTIYKSLLQYSKIDYEDILELLKTHSANFFWNGMSDD